MIAMKSGQVKMIMATLLQTFGVSATA